MKQIEYIVKEGNEVLRDKCHHNIDLYPNLVFNLQSHFSNPIPRQRYWEILNYIKVFPFIYKEAEKQLENGS
jgi:hypothetical protein